MNLNNVRITWSYPQLNREWYHYRSVCRISFLNDLSFMQQEEHSASIIEQTDKIAEMEQILKEKVITFWSRKIETATNLQSRSIFFPCI